MKICSTCEKEIVGAVFLLSEQIGQWCSEACRNSQIVPLGQPEPFVLDSPLDLPFVPD
jgi:hypothetical protein